MNMKNFHKKLSIYLIDLYLFQGTKEEKNKNFKMKFKLKTPKIRLLKTLMIIEINVTSKHSNVISNKK